MAIIEMASPARLIARPPIRLTVSMLTATAIVVADMVGVGVFTSLGFQVQGIPSGFSLLLLWVVGGGVALCGVFSYGELAAMFPRSSGEYNFLRQTYHPALGFVAGWLSATVGFAAPVALAAMAFGEYGKAILPGAPPLALGIGVVWIVSLVGLRSIHHSSAFQMAWTVLKVVLILAFLIAGFALATPQPISFAPSAADPSHVISAPFAISLVFVMYSYSGWNAATYIVGEMRDPQRSLPRSLLVGTSIVIVLYVALNALFLYATPIDQLAGQIDVAVIAGKHIFGDLGGRNSVERSLQLFRAALERFAVGMFQRAFADRDDRRQLVIQSRAHFAGHARIGLPEDEATLGVSEDYVANAQFAQHERADLAGERSVVRRMHVLRAETESRISEQRVHGSERGKGRCDDGLDVVRQAFLEQLADQLPRLCDGLVHLPVAHDQGTARTRTGAHARTPWRSAARSRAATPGSVLPSRNSSVAPPPVETCVIALANPSSCAAAAASPPPTTLTAPARVAAAIASPTARVPLW